MTPAVLNAAVALVLGSWLPTVAAQTTPAQSLPLGEQPPPAEVAHEPGADASEWALDQLVLWISESPTPALDERVLEALDRAQLSPRQRELVDRASAAAKRGDVGASRNAVVMLLANLRRVYGTSPPDTEESALAGLPVDTGLLRIDDTWWSISDLQAEQPGETFELSLTQLAAGVALRHFALDEFERSAIVDPEAAWLLESARDPDSIENPAAVAVAWSGVLSRRLWPRYGGRTAFSKFGGSVAFEAIERFLRDHAAHGRLELHAAFAPLFWDELLNPSTRYVSDPEPDDTIDTLFEPYWRRLRGGGPLAEPTEDELDAAAEALDVVRAWCRTPEGRLDDETLGWLEPLCTTPRQRARLLALRTHSALRTFVDARVAALALLDRLGELPADVREFALPADEAVLTLDGREWTVGSLTLLRSRRVGGKPYVPPWIPRTDVMSMASWAAEAHFGGELIEPAAADDPEIARALAVVRGAEFSERGGFDLITPGIWNCEVSRAVWPLYGGPVSRVKMPPGTFAGHALFGLLQQRADERRLVPAHEHAEAFWAGARQLTTAFHQFDPKPGATVDELFPRSWRELLAKLEALGLAREAER